MSGRFYNLYINIWLPMRELRYCSGSIMATIPKQFPVALQHPEISTHLGAVEHSVQSICVTEAQIAPWVTAPRSPL